MFFLSCHKKIWFFKNIAKLPKKCGRFRCSSGEIGSFIVKAIHISKITRNADTRIFVTFKIYNIWREINRRRKRLNILFKSFWTQLSYTSQNSSCQKSWRLKFVLRHVTGMDVRNGNHPGVYSDSVVLWSNIIRKRYKTVKINQNNLI